MRICCKNSLPWDKAILPRHESEDAQAAALSLSFCPFCHTVLVSVRFRELCLADRACEHVIVIKSAPSAGYHRLIANTRSANDGRP